MTFFLTSLFMIWVFWRPQEWLFPQLFGWPLLQVLFGMAVLSFGVEVSEKRLSIPKRLPQMYLLLGVWLAGALSHVPHTYLAGMLESIPDVGRLCMFTLLLICVLDRPSRLRGVAWIFVLMASVMAVHALMQHRTYSGFIGSRPIVVHATADRDGYTRSLFFGIFGDPNDLAQILGTTIPFGFALFRRGWFKNMLIGAGIAAFLLTAVMTTYSRGGQVGLLVIFFALLLLVLPAKWLPTLLTIGIIGGLAGIPLASGMLDASARDRIVFWGWANQMFKENMIFGIGYNMFWQVASARAAHNAFVLCYTELGIVGYWFWFGLLLTGVLGAWRTRVAMRNVRTVEGRWLFRFSGLMIAALLGFCASSYFLTRAFVFPLFFLVGIMAALPRVGARLLEQPEPLLTWNTRLVVINTVVSMGSILYIYVSILGLNRVYL